MLYGKKEFRKSAILLKSYIVNPCSEIKIKSCVCGELLQKIEFHYAGSSRCRNF